MKTRLLVIAALLLFLSQPAWAQTDATSLPANNKVNRDLVKIAAVQISGYDKGDARREGYDVADELVLPADTYARYAA